MTSLRVKSTVYSRESFGEMSQRQTINSFFSPVRKCTDGTHCSIVKFCQTRGSRTFTPTAKGTKRAAEKRPVGRTKKKTKTEPALSLGDHEDAVIIRTFF